MSLPVTRGNPPGPSLRQPSSSFENSTLEIIASEEEDGGFKPFTGHRNGIMAIAYAPDGRHLATGSPDKTIRVWDVRTGVQVGEPMEGHTDEGRYASGMSRTGHILPLGNLSRRTPAGS